jgi:hypothetical protein
LKQPIARLATPATVRQAVAFNQMAALGVASYVVLAALPVALPLPAHRLYSISFLLSWLGWCGLAVTAIGAVAALSRHWLTRSHRPAHAAYWLSLSKGLVLIGVAAAVLMYAMDVVRPSLQTRMLFGMQVHPHVVTLSGATPDDMDSQLAAALGTGQRIDRVELSGIGGAVDAAERAAELLKAHGATTVVAVGDCVSACAVMFEQFSHRYVAPGGRLGFHAFWGGGLFAAANAQQHEIDHLVARGVAPAFANQLFASSATTWPSVTALRAHQLINDCWDTQIAAPSSCETTFASR